MAIDVALVEKATEDFGCLMSHLAQTTAPPDTVMKALRLFSLLFDVLHVPTSTPEAEVPLKSHSAPWSRQEKERRRSAAVIPSASPKRKDRTGAGSKAKRAAAYAARRERYDQTASAPSSALPSAPAVPLALSSSPSSAQVAPSALLSASSSAPAAPLALSSAPAALAAPSALPAAPSSALAASSAAPSAPAAPSALSSALLSAPPSALSSALPSALAAPSAPSSAPAAPSALPSAPAPLAQQLVVPALAFSTGPLHGSRDMGVTKKKKTEKKSNKQVGKQGCATTSSASGISLRNRAIDPPPGFSPLEYMTVLPPSPLRHVDVRNDPEFHEFIETLGPWCRL